MRESANLDLLRSVAVLLVVISHLPAALGYENGRWSAVKYSGEFGVLIFFIHTALVLMMSLDRSEGPAFIRRFYIRRAFRIYPLSIAIILLLMLLQIPAYFRQVYSTPNALTLWSNLLLIQNITHASPLLGPLWSLPYEVQMYIALPFIYLFGKRYGGVSVMVAVSVVVWYVCRRFDLGGDLLTYLPWFVMGAAIHFHGVRVQLPSWTYYVALGLLVAAPITWRFLAGGHGLKWIELGCCGLFAASLSSFPEIRSAWITRGCHCIAKYSYGIYLSHVPILWLTFEKMAMMPVAIRLGTCVCLLVVVPFALYWTIEHPMMKIGSSLARIVSRKATVAVEIYQHA